MSGHKKLSFRHKKVLSKKPLNSDASASAPSAKLHTVTNTRHGPRFQFSTLKNCPKIVRKVKKISKIIHRKKISKKVKNQFLNSSNHGPSLISYAVPFLSISVLHEVWKWALTLIASMLKKHAKSKRRVQKANHAEEDGLMGVRRQILLPPSLLPSKWISVASTVQTETLERWVTEIGDLGWRQLRKLLQEVIVTEVSIFSSPPASPCPRCPLWPRLACLLRPVDDDDTVEHCWDFSVFPWKLIKFSRACLEALLAE